MLCSQLQFCSTCAPEPLIIHDRRPLREALTFNRSLRLPAVATSTCTAAAAAATAVTSAKVRLARPGFVHLDITAFEIRIVELFNRAARFFGGRHLDEAKPLGLS